MGWKIQNGYGFSWGIAGFRVGQNQYGKWWVSVGLPLGFRVTKYLSYEPKNNFSSNNQPGIQNSSTSSSFSKLSSRHVSNHLTHNQQVLENIKNQKP